jgi:diadenosine tetraphosphate (Ap4A) HIT family hydrolase
MERYNSMENDKCLFCRVQDKNYKKEIIFENKFFFVTRDSYPVTKFHTLVISKRHVASYFDLTIDEANELQEILIQQRNEITTLDSAVSAFNIGINDGKDAGQTIRHLHVHLIPRRYGDMQNPQGGVRGVIPGKQKYNRKNN